MEIARTIVNEESRARALTALAPHLPHEWIIDALNSAHAIKDKKNLAKDTRFRAHVLTRLVPHLPPELFTEALQVVGTIASGSIRAEALVKLTPHLPSELLAEALDAARTIKHEDSRVESLVKLTPHLPPSEQNSILTEALQVARAIGDDLFRAKTLGSLVPHLSPNLLAEGLGAAHAISSEYSHVEVLAKLAPILTGIPANDHPFASTLRISARRGRPVFLRDLTVLMPWQTARYAAEGSDTGYLSDLVPVSHGRGL